MQFQVLESMVEDTMIADSVSVERIFAGSDESHRVIGEWRNVRKEEETDHGSVEATWGVGGVLQAAMQRGYAMAAGE
jgi:hypothetical protein